MDDLKHTADPSLLTTQQLIRELSLLREILEARLNCNDEDITHIKGELEKIPGLINASDQHVSDLFNEKFASIQVQFKERDIRTDQTSRDSKIAVDAALQAAKELSGEQNKASSQAIAKSEAATSKQIDQIAILINSVAKSTDEKIDDLKGRQDKGEGRSTGVREYTRDVKDDSKAYYAIIISVVSIVVTIVFSVLQHLKGF